MLLLKVAAVTASIPVLMTAGAASMDWMVVDVKEGGPSGHRIVVPVPMMLARAAVSFVPQPQMPVPPAELRDAAPMAQAALAALTEAPDFELVRVEDRGEVVSIRKEDGKLRIEVDSKNERVRVNVPLSAAQAVLDGAASGQVRTAALLDAMADADGDLVEVTDGKDHVRIWMW
jgi:hypothetical protein